MLVWFTQSPEKLHYTNNDTDQLNTEDLFDVFLSLFFYRMGQVFDASDYYNYYDLNRVETNTQYIKDRLAEIGYYANTGLIDSNKDNTSLVFYNDINRVESNINELKNCSYTPSNWQNMELDWISVYKIFDYTDANRYENNLTLLNEMTENIADEMLYCGTFYLGDELGNLFSDWGLL